MDVFEGNVRITRCGVWRLCFEPSAAKLCFGSETKPAETFKYSSHFTSSYSFGAAMVYAVNAVVF